METPSTQPETPPPPRKRRRWIVVVLFLLLLVPVLLIAFGALALGNLSVRQAILARISRSFEESSGIRVGADDFRLQVREGVLELDAVTLSAGDATAFLTADLVRVEFDWDGLFADPRVLKTLVLERPVADLRQPLPPPSDEPPPAIDVHDLRLTGGRLLGTVPESEGESWLREWSAEDVDISGAYVGGRAELALEPARLRLVRTQDGPLDLEVSSRVAGPLEGPWTLDDVRLTGDGLSLDASGELGTGEGQPLFVRLDLDADPSILLKEVDPGSRLQAEGEIDLRRFRGAFTVTARDFPSAALEPWIGEAARPGGKPSFIDLEARFASDPAATPQITGGGGLVWRRQDGGRLAEAAVKLTDGRLDDDGVVLDSLVGEVHATAADLPVEFLRPWLGADQLARLDARGTRLDLEADVVVDAAAPSAATGNARVVWRRGTERLVQATVRTLDGGTGEELEIAVDATLLPAETGRRSVAGKIAGPSWPELAGGELRDVVVELQLPDVTAAIEDVHRRWPRLFDEAGIEIESLPAALRGAVEATARLEGRLRDPRAELDATWRPDASSSLTVAASGRPLAKSGEVRLELDGLDLALIPGEMAGRLRGWLEAKGTPESWTAAAELDGADLRYGTEMPTFEELHFEATTDGSSLEVAAFSGRKGEARFEGDGGLELSGRLGDVAPAELRIRTGRLRLAADQPFSGVDRLDFDADLADGAVHVTRLDLEAPTGPGTLEAVVPLGALSAFDIDVDAWPVEVAGGRIKLDLDFPSLDVGALAADVGQEAPWTSHVASLTGRVWIDPADLTATEGELLVETWRLEMGRHRIEVGDDPILLALADRQLEVLPVTLQANGHPVDFRAVVDLGPEWRPGDPMDQLVAHLTANAEGTVESGLLTPYLAGGVAQGPLEITAEASGRLDELKAHAIVDGPKATVLYASPYVTQIRAPRFEVDLDGQEVIISGATAQLNGGPLNLDALRTDEGEWTVGVKFESARFRVDYGVTAVLNGDLRLELPAEGAGNLVGDIEVYRAIQRRELILDREIMNVLFAPPEISGAGTGAFDDLRLDLTVTTAQGFRVKNNLADLRGSWSTLQIQGTLGDPAIDGRIDIDSGGYVFAYGQTARLDQGALIFTGEPGLPPEMEVEITWASEDPTIAASGDRLQEVRMSWQRDQDKKEQTTLDDRLLEGFTGFVGSKVDRRLGRTRVKVQPVLVFGETDPSAKLVVSRDLSSWIAFAVAVDLRNSQRQTYVLELHKLKVLPRVTFQLFTEEGVPTNASDTIAADTSESEEGGAEGITVQQTLTFGKSKADPDSLYLRRVIFETVLREDLSEKALRRAVGVRKGEELPEEPEFEVEINLLEHLRRRGYPGARVDVVLEPGSNRRADLSISIASGPKVKFRFEGDEPPGSLRRSITEPYRVDFYERASLEEVRQQAVRALRSQGYLDPRVEVEVQGDEPQKARTVIVTAEGGRRIRLDRLIFRGIDATAALALQDRFETVVARVELAAGVPDADEWLVRNLGSLGYPEASVVSHKLSEDGRELSVQIDAGQRQELASVEIAGLSEIETQRLLPELPLAAGDVPRSDLIVAGSLAIRNDLKSRGYAESRVKTQMRPVEEGSHVLDLTYEVEPGPQYRVETVRFAGLQSTRLKWARKTANVEESEIYHPDLLGQARRQLFASRVFSTVRTQTERSPDGEAQVTFEVEEAPRYEFAYGVRWESGDGSSASDSSLVTDLRDRNFLGRGITIGLRTLYGERDKAARLYSSTTGLFARQLTTEVFIERRREETRPSGILDGNGEVIDDSFVIDTTLGALQFSHPLGNVTSRPYVKFKEQTTRENVPLFPDFPFEETVRFPFVGWQVIYDTLDDRVAPTSGMFVSTDLSATGDYIASDFDFLRLFTHFKWMRPAFRIGGQRVVWAQSYRFGWLVSENDPPISSELFRTGGERSVRGYPFEGLVVPRFPDDPFFEIRPGGESLLVMNQELRIPIWGEISGIVFLDVGNAWGDKSDFGSDLATGVGLGIRAGTPVGLLRLDFAYPLDPLVEDPSITTYFGFGHAF